MRIRDEEKIAALTLTMEQRKEVFNSPDGRIEGENADQFLRRKRVKRYLQHNQELLKIKKPLFRLKK